MCPFKGIRVGPAYIRVNEHRRQKLIFDSDTLKEVRYEILSEQVKNKSDVSNTFADN